jgi:predicted nucleic acid-binding protein
LRRVVADASVVLKWYLPDEDQGQAALDLLSLYLSDDLEIIVPSLLEYEIINALVVAQKRGRIKEGVIISAIEGFLNLGIKTVRTAGLYPRILHFCRVYSRSAYDASYLALAEAEQIHFITADETLYNAIRKDFTWVKSLGHR